MIRKRPCGDLARRRQSAGSAGKYFKCVVPGNLAVASYRNGQDHFSVLY
jgi:hypothetical protein